LATYAYAVRGRKPLSLDLYAPAGRRDTPVVLLLHGGGWSDGSRRDLAPACKMLAAAGMAAATADYRLAPGTRWPGQLEDAESAMLWLESRNRFTSLGIWGVSAGAHIALMLAAVRKDADAVVSWFGPTDLTQQPSNNVQERHVRTLLGDGDTAARRKEASPLYNAIPHRTPALFVHGDRDALVPVDHSVRMANAWRTAGGTVTQEIVRGSGHGLGLSRERMARQSVAWLRSKLLR
jgi:acetyl esterase/lipase